MESDEEEMLGTLEGVLDVRGTFINLNIKRSYCMEHDEDVLYGTSSATL